MLQEDQNPDIQVRIEDFDNGGHRVLKYINPNEVHGILGRHLNITNNNTKLTKTLVAKSKEINTDFLTSHLRAKQ